MLSYQATVSPPGRLSPVFETDRFAYSTGQFSMIGFQSNNSQWLLVLQDSFDNRQFSTRRFTESSLLQKSLQYCHPTYGQHYVISLHSLPPNGLPHECSAPDPYSHDSCAIQQKKKWWPALTKNGQQTGAIGHSIAVGCLTHVVAAVRRVGIRDVQVAVRQHDDAVVLVRARVERSFVLVPNLCWCRCRLRIAD